MKINKYKRNIKIYKSKGQWKAYVDFKENSREVRKFFFSGISKKDVRQKMIDFIVEFYLFQKNTKESKNE